MQHIDNQIDRIIDPGRGRPVVAIWQQIVFAVVAGMQDRQRMETGRAIMAAAAGCDNLPGGDPPWRLGDEK
jgi:hypothetical protein